VSLEENMKRGKLMKGKCGRKRKRGKKKVKFKLKGQNKF
jgi:hypothetical protein